MKTCFSKLNSEMQEKQISIKELAELLNFSVRHMRRKMIGYAPFTLEEIKKIRDNFFPDCTLDELFGDDNNE